MTYNDPGAQLATFTTPRNETYQLTYDAWGRVEHEQSPDGSSHHFERTGMPWDYEVTHTSALGRLKWSSDLWTEESGNLGCRLRC